MKKFNFNFKFKIKNVKLVIILLVIAILVLVFVYYKFIFSPINTRNKFANELIQRSDENSIFHIQKILIYSSASVINNADTSTLNDMSISQYSDFSIYIDNRLENSELTDENTVKELYIDNISIEPNLIKRGTKLLNYKNPLIFGKYSNIAEFADRIDFKIINTNVENDDTDYSEPTFYTDCSNPITLGYLNKDILKHFSLPENSTSVSFNGKILKDANINLTDINYTLNFTIHIVNNLNQNFSYNMSFDSEFDESFFENGYAFQGAELNGSENRFLRN